MTHYLFDKHDRAEHEADLAVKRAGSRRSDPDTSRGAAEEVEASGVAGAQRLACLRVVQQHPGLTAAEIAEKAGLERHAASRRLPELRPKWVKNGEPRTCSVQGTRAMTWWPNNDSNNS